MSSDQFPRDLEDIIRANPAGALELIIEELQGILDQPALPAGRPHAAAQQVNKHEAQNGLERLYRRFPELETHAIKSLQQIIDAPSLPSGHPDTKAVEQEKRRARITLAWWKLNTVLMDPDD
jgi:hypothetical protein